MAFVKYTASSPAASTAHVRLSGASLIVTQAGQDRFPQLAAAEFLSLYYNPEGLQIGLAPSTQEDKDAFKLTRRGRGTSKVVSAARFFEQFGLQGDELTTEGMLARRAACWSLERSPKRACHRGALAAAEASQEGDVAASLVLPLLRRCLVRCLVKCPPEPSVSSGQSQEASRLPEQRLPSLSSDQASAAAPPLTRAELEALYLQQRLSLQQIADLASERLGITVSRAKVREWLLWHRIARRSFSEAAQAKFEKQARSGSAGGSALGSEVQPSLFEE